MKMGKDLYRKKRRPPAQLPVSPVSVVVTPPVSSVQSEVTPKESPATTLSPREEMRLAILAANAQAEVSAGRSALHFKIKRGG